MFGRTTSCTLGLGIVMLAVMAGSAQAQATGSNSKVITWKPATNAAENYVGILGEIAKPRVYKVNSQALNLQSIIRIAGGMTDDASGTIRIVRQDRIVESIFFNPQSNLPLLPGDLLIVESKRIQAAFSRLYEADPQTRAKYAQAAEIAVKGTDPSGIQLAFVNVLDRPVIVKIKHEHATLAQVVQKLDQPIELAQSIRVIGPERMLSQGATTQPIDTTIADGSVLVFPASAVNRSRLPSLPVPYDSEIAAGAIPSLIGGAAGQSPELRNVGQLPPLAAREFPHEAPAVRFPTSADQATTPLPAPTQTPNPAPAERLEIPAAAPQLPLVSSPPRIATIPFSGTSRISSSSQSHISHDEDAPRHDAVDVLEPRVEPKMPRSPSVNLDEDLLEDELLDESDTDKKGSLTAGHIAGIIACVGLLIGLALATRRFVTGSSMASNKQPRSVAAESPSDVLTTTPSPSPAEQLPASTEFGQTELASPVIEQDRQPSTATLAKAWFDQLLGNQLPVREESAEFPQNIALQGRIVPPPVYRVDPPTTRMTQGPHFSLRTPPEQDASKVDPQMEEEVEQVIDEFDAPHNSRPAKPHFLKRRAGENTIAAAASKNSNSSAKAEVKSSTTPLTDALRQLQGGQS